MAIFKVVTNWNHSQLGTMTSIESFSKGCLTGLTIVSSIYGAICVIGLIAAVGTLSERITITGQAIDNLIGKLGEAVDDARTSIKSNSERISTSISKTIDSYSTDSLLR